jgi:hypothetical protein
MCAALMIERTLRAVFVAALMIESCWKREKYCNNQSTKPQPKYFLIHFSPHSCHCICHKYCSKTCRNEQKLNGKFNALMTIYVCIVEWGKKQNCILLMSLKNASYFGRRNIFSLLMVANFTHKFVYSWKQD